MVNGNAVLIELVRAGSNAVESSLFLNPSRSRMGRGSLLCSCVLAVIVEGREELLGPLLPRCKRVRHGARVAS